jgi:hypothetical protein
MNDKELAMATQIAKIVTDQLVERAQDPEQVGRVLDTWSSHVQKMVGRAVLRVLWWVLLTVLFVASVKLGFWEKLHAALGGKP